MDNKSTIQELKKGAQSWNKWRKSVPVGKLNLDGIELNDVDLDNVDLSKVSMRNAVISHCRFRYADFISADLEGSLLQNNDFSHAKLIATRLTHCDLSGSKLLHTNMLTAITKNTKLENIDFSGLDISGLTLSDVSLAGSNLSGQKLARVDFSNSNLTAVNFENADLTNVVVSGADLTRANFKGAILKGVVAKAAKMTGLDLQGFDLTKADFTDADLQNCDLREVNFTKAKLASADITGSKLWNLATNGWVIANIVCDHAYWDKAGNEKTIYRTHEFERIFGESITIELRYPYRLADHELATLPIFIEHLAAVNWGIILRLKSISDVAGGALVKFVVEEVGGHNPTRLKAQLQDEADRIQLAQLALRTDSQLHLQLRERIASIREELWPRLLELAADHEKDQVRNLTIVFMDLKGFSKWRDDELSEKLSLFRGLVKPILNKWSGNYPNMEGDSLRVTFTNATAGLSCACMIRNVLMAAGFELRVGVELGEVLVVRNEVTEIPDLEGVAVSMAARLEAAADVGEILVSHRVRHYAERSNLFEFIPRHVPLKKSIGTMIEGDHVDCFAVIPVKNLQEVLV
ncbi:MAG: hypothetical protein EOO53_00180 [Gammaproteobacteria bacterium]|nr:MAG: hypothetical protein EOO53_00180 [Gammaproteobacteria bacterium]